MNAFEVQRQVESGFVHLMKPSGETFRFILLKGKVQALTVNDLPLKEGDVRGPNREVLGNNLWEAFHACKLSGNLGASGRFTGLRKF